MTMWQNVWTVLSFSLSSSFYQIHWSDYGAGNKWPNAAYSRIFFIHPVSHLDPFCKNLMPTDAIWKYHTPTLPKKNVNKNIKFGTFDMHTEKNGEVAFIGHIVACTFYLHFIYEPYICFPTIPVCFVSFVCFFITAHTKCGTFGYLNIYDEGLYQFTLFSKEQS